MDTVKTPEDEKPAKPPSPLDFDVFLPWAFRQLQFNETVVVKKVVQTDYVSQIATDRSKGKAKSKQSKEFGNLDLQQDDDESRKNLTFSSYNIYVTAVYDPTDHLIQLQFLNNKNIPRIIFKIINLIIKYHESLNTITINKGLDEYTLYEICKFLPFSNITDICLDNTFLKEANYYVLLESRTSLRHLSLRRCSINDIAIEALANTLIYPYPASKTLSILNLASNRITDKGAGYLANVLRSNRHISYLNLSDNSISDIGGISLLDTLQKFPLTFAELLASRSRQMTYLKEKNDLIAQYVKNLRAGDFDKKAAKRKSIKPTSAKSKGPEREISLKCVLTNRCLTNSNQILNEKATNMAENSLGIFTDPFDKSNTTVKDSIVYCHGNNSLCYLNLAYNNLTYITLKKLLTVLKYQKETRRQPIGLINVTIEGNYMPVACKELSQIENIIENGLLAGNRRVSAVKKKSPKPIR